MAAYKCIDISHHNTITNWNKVKAAGIDAVIIRAGYGRTRDKKFIEHIEGAKAAGLPVGVYWFAYPLNVADAKAEADFMHGVIKSYKIDLGVWYDFEYDSERYAEERGVKYTNKLRTDVIEAFCERARGYGYKVGLYLNRDYIDYRLDYSALKAFPLWLANWTTNGVTSFSAASPGAVSMKYGAPVIWQFGKGKVAGSANNTDLNYIYCDLPATAPTVAYFAKCNYTGVSLVDALRQVGANTAFAYRKKIAAANGIKLYAGTAAQNTKMLNLLKAGKLVKP